MILRHRHKGSVSVCPIPQSINQSIHEGLSYKLEGRKSLNLMITFSRLTRNWSCQFSVKKRSNQGHEIERQMEGCNAEIAAAAGNRLRAYGVT